MLFKVHIFCALVGIQSNSYTIHNLKHTHINLQNQQNVKNVFVSIKPLNVSVFFHDHLQGVLRCALCRYYSSRWFAFVEFVLLRSMWPHVYVICVCLVFLSVGDLLVKQITNRQEHQIFPISLYSINWLVFITEI